MLSYFVSFSAFYCLSFVAYSSEQLLVFRVHREDPFWLNVVYEICQLVPVHVA